MLEWVPIERKMPLNYGEFKRNCVVETLKEGTDITLVSYGSTLRLVHKQQMNS
jgi:hypothetical protein